MILTGSPRGRKPDLPSRLADRLGADRALPYLALASHAKPHGLEALAGELGVTNQLMALSTPDFGWPRPGSRWGDPGLAPSAAERAAVDAFLSGSVDRLVDGWGSGGEPDDGRGRPCAQRSGEGAGDGPRRLDASGRRTR